MRDQEVVRLHAGRLRHRDRRGARRGSGLCVAVGHGRVDDVGEGKLRVVEAKRQPPGVVPKLDAPAEAVGRDVLALDVEDRRRRDRDVGEPVELRVEERDRAVIADAWDLSRVDAPAPGPDALSLADRQKLLQCWPVDEDALGALGDRAGDAVLEAVPVPRPCALRRERDRRAAAADPEARVLNGELDAGLGMPDQRSLGIRCSESLAQERGRAFRAARRAEQHDRHEDRSDEHRQRRQAHRGCAAKNGDALGFRRAFTGPQFRKVRHGSQSSGALHARDSWTRDRPARGRGGLDSVRERTELPELPSFE